MQAESLHNGMVW